MSEMLHEKMHKPSADPKEDECGVPFSATSPPSLRVLRIFFVPIPTVTDETYEQRKAEGVPVAQRFGAERDDKPVPEQQDDIGIQKYGQDQDWQEKKPCRQ